MPSVSFSFSDLSKALTESTPLARLDTLTGKSIIYLTGAPLAPSVLNMDIRLHNSSIELPLTFPHKEGIALSRKRRPLDVHE